jgi:hypothetical protein
VLSLELGYKSANKDAFRSAIKGLSSTSSEFGRITFPSSFYTSIGGSKLDIATYGTYIAIGLSLGSYNFSTKLGKVRRGVGL